MTVPKARISVPVVPAFSRPRLDQALARLWGARVGLVVAPPGSGKTTLLSLFAASASAPVAWYRAEPTDSSAVGVLRALEMSLATTVSGFPVGATNVEELIVALDSLGSPSVVVVVDDFHSVQTTPAEGVFERLIVDAPPDLRLLLASRSTPTFSLARFRVSGQLVEVTADDLRFRAWEVEQLFRDFYREPLPPEDLAELARRTEGWAAGLQLFHLATRGKPATERRRVLQELGSRSRVVREYLAHNVLDELASDLRAFLLGTCLLGRLTGAMCDKLLDRTDSQEVLEELERRQIFTVALDDGSTYRYHEVLRTCLEAVLADQVGEAEVRRRHQEAGVLLQEAGFVGDAVRAFCRAEHWDAASKLVGSVGEQLAADQTSWLDSLPSGLLEEDPWVLLARARQYVRLGRLRPAVDAYERAEKAFGRASPSDVCRRERLDVAFWLDPSPVPRIDWLGLLRSAVQRSPLLVAREAAALPGSSGRFVEGVARLLAGHTIEGARLLQGTSELPDQSPVLDVAAQLLATICRAACAPDRAGGLGPLVDQVEVLAIPWMSRLCRTAAVIVNRRPDEIPNPAAWRHSDDPWGAAGMTLFEAFVDLRRERPAGGLFDEAARAFHALGAGVLEAWAQAGLAVATAREGRVDAEDVAVAAVDTARTAGVPGAEALALMALGSVGRSGRHEDLLRGERLAAECGIQWVDPLPNPPTRPKMSEGRTARRELNGVRPRRVSRPPVTLRCFGGFVLEVEGQSLDCRNLKPRSRAALHLMALHAGRPLHRETLIGALWPEVDTDAGTRNLHVVLSSLRQFLEPGAARGDSSWLPRDGDTYRLALPSGATVDLQVFGSAVSESADARAAGQCEAAVQYLEQALAVYVGDLLPEDGPAEWVVAERERYQRLAAGAAQALAELFLEGGDPRAAATACGRGLRIDRYCDPLWRLLVRACEEAGDLASAARARTSYDEVLAELGVSPAGRRVPVRRQ